MDNLCEQGAIAVTLQVHDEHGGVLDEEMTWRHMKRDDQGGQSTRGAMGIYHVGAMGNNGGLL